MAVKLRKLSSGMRSQVSRAQKVTSAASKGLSKGATKATSAIRSAVRKAAPKLKTGSSRIRKSGTAPSFKGRKSSSASLRRRTPLSGRLSRRGRGASKKG